MLDSCVLRRRAVLDVNVSLRRNCLQHKMIKRNDRAKKQKHHILANKMDRGGVMPLLFTT
jgi:hypothetical protein